MNTLHEVVDYTEAQAAARGLTIQHVDVFLGSAHDVLFFYAYGGGDVIVTQMSLPVRFRGDDLPLKPWRQAFKRALHVKAGRDAKDATR